MYRYKHCDMLILGKHIVTQYDDAGVGMVFSIVEMLCVLDCAVLQLGSNFNTFCLVPHMLYRN